MKEEQTRPLAAYDINHQDIQSIKAVLEQFETESNRKNPEATAALVTPDAVLVNILGLRFAGREAFYPFIKQAMEGSLSHLILKNEITDIQFIRPDVAVVSVNQIASTKDGDVLKEQGRGRVTLVLVKEQGHWFIAVGQNTMIGNWKIEC